MEIQTVLKELDGLFASNQTGQVEDFLQRKLKEAAEVSDASSSVTLYNELIGFYRDTSQYEKASACCEQVLELLKQMGLKGSVHYGTTLLNAANAWRAAGKHQRSLRAYDEAEKIYQKELEPGDFRFASLLNNKSLLFQEMGDFTLACRCLEQALDIVEKYPEAVSELAVTHSNLGASMLHCGKKQEGKTHLKKALELFEQLSGENTDFHYSAALDAFGDACRLDGEAERAAEYYARAMEELEKHVGRTENWARVREKLQEVQRVLGTPDQGLELCRLYYANYGADMIRRQFPEYENRIAVGLAGEGSDCFGFDDQLSRDHDFGPRFCMWLTDEDFEQIGEPLQAAYDALPGIFHGVPRQISPERNFRDGVMRISDFYRYLAGSPEGPENMSAWLAAEDCRLAAAVNGAVFRDDLGAFSEIRDRLKRGWPEAVRALKIAEEAALLMQSGPYNYNRMMSRREWVAAGLERAAWEEHLLRLVHFLNHAYPPHRKWLHKSCGRLDILGGAADILNAAADMGDQRRAWEKMEPGSFRDLVNGEDQISLTMELTGQILLREMKAQRLLPDYASGLAGAVPLLKKRAKAEQITWLEWKAFDQVQNEGGRAGCQDDWETFHIMRLSQYLTWPEKLLDLWCRALEQGMSGGWNPVQEKYARMMESTALEEYRKLEQYLPEIGEKQKALIEALVKIQVKWMEEFAAGRPHLAGNARIIHTAEDKPWDTSFETYLRGELSTYPPEVLEGYGWMVADCLQKERNLTEETMKWSAYLYGYSSLDEAEEKAGRQEERE